MCQSSQLSQLSVSQTHTDIRLQFTTSIYLLSGIYYTFAWNLFNLENIAKLLKAPYCSFQECCNENWIKFDRNRLFSNFTKDVYGQPLLRTAIEALAAHFNPQFKNNKALTISFHGMTGTGKNYVADLIANSIYAEGIRSKYVHHFIGRLHFSETRHAYDYKRDLYIWLRGNITKCPSSLFIFDEVDKMIPEVLNSIKPMLDYRHNVDGVDYSKAIFIFLSNTGADLIREHYYDLFIKDGKNREDMTISDFEHYIEKGAFNENGGYHLSDAIKHNVIDHYIPFLPLEQKHVIKCILKEFLIRQVPYPKQAHIEEILKHVEWGPDNSQLFSKTGCKRLGPKVGLLVYQHYDNHYYDDKYEL